MVCPGPREGPGLFSLYCNMQCKESLFMIPKYYAIVKKIVQHCFLYR